MKTGFLITLMILLGFNAKCQKPEDPSTWPEPTAELIKNGYYTPDKLEKYWSWKKNTLPDLYIKFDEGHIKLSELKWKKNNYQYRFNLNTLSIEFVVDNQPSKRRYAEIRELNATKVDSLNVKDAVWLEVFFKEQNATQSNYCYLIDKTFKSINFIVRIQHQPIKSYKVSYCLCDFDE